jgi:hypothetical protein
MDDIATRICHLAGPARDVGLAAGRALGERLEQNISRYLRELPGRNGVIDLGKLHSGALPWLRSLPQRFQDELEGMAEGAGLPLQRLVEWTFVEECVRDGCSGLACSIDGHAWVGRNNDTYVPGLWGYLAIREIDGRIPTISFSMEGDVFAPTGINRDRLWLHHNYLDVADAPTPGKTHYPGYVFVVEALETCRTIDDVEALLSQVDRDGGMLLFAVDGKTDEFEIFECTCATHARRVPTEKWIVGTNHYCALENPPPSREHFPDSRSRFARIEAMAQRVCDPVYPADVPADLIRILADESVERRDEEFATVYANVACPATGVIWYTFGGYPAASRGDWRRVEWPWAQ